jgi:methylaspartate ammonia-lyase
MILKEVDAMPHALINNVKEKLGYNGEILLEYVTWLKNRILSKRNHKDYSPILHVDVYGTIGIAFENNIDRIVKYCKDLEIAASPFSISLEGPIDSGDREGTMQALERNHKTFR